ncbi:hypothetical protein BZG36_02177 [Bifiguratus adelaidae]|uniref:SAM-dependent MTase RsmB/NOP-type domain-containing protein n=1 Tax=Bifiguratus adelaidae TaxID=1938954 RepID=A0A261Y0N9_9FUNG|nr:hypothetical protein BZG36_02177 [Bifiguratus adelaidae]
MNTYYKAAEILSSLLPLSKDGDSKSRPKSHSLKQLVLGNPDIESGSKSRIYALVHHTLARRAVLRHVIETAGVHETERKVLQGNKVKAAKKKSAAQDGSNPTIQTQDTSYHLLLLLVNDILFSKGGIQASSGPVKDAVMRHGTRLKAELVKYKVSRGITNDQDLEEGGSAASRMPRYARVNTIKTSSEALITELTNDSFDLLPSPPQDLAKPPAGRSIPFWRDTHLSHDLLVFSPGTDFHKHKAYLDGRIILQDKASCFPARVAWDVWCAMKRAELEPNADEISPSYAPDAIDACAAPGNKTSHLSALFTEHEQILRIGSSKRLGKAKVHAFDLDAKRLATLERLCHKAGCTNIVATNGSFLKVDPLDERYKDVEILILDPSCSGSGIVDRWDLDEEEEVETESKGSDTEMDETNGLEKTKTVPNAKTSRLRALAEFQSSVIKHAFQFPKANTIVYSTCSIHAQENEHVVREVLCSAEAQMGEMGSWMLAPRSVVLPTWPRRGIDEEFGSLGFEETFSNIRGKSELSAELDASKAHECADALIRALPEDHMNGFFVSCLVRGPAAAKFGAIDLFSRSGASHSHKRTIDLGHAGETESTANDATATKKRKKLSKARRQKAKTRAAEQDLLSTTS